MKDTDADTASCLFREGLKYLRVPLSEQTVQHLVLYCHELRKWNRKVNLVAKETSLEDTVEKHFLDSITLLPVLQEFSLEKGTLLDVGSGAGFPGLVMKTICPDLQVILMEPRLKRVSFLNHIIRLLGLKGIEVLSCRTDQEESLPDITYNVITGRAVADVSSFLLMVADLAKPGTMVICMQGKSGKKQWQEAEDNPVFSRVSLKYVQLPRSKADRYILVFKK